MISATRGSRLPIALRLKAWLTSLRIWVCSGGSITIIMLVFIGCFWSSSSRVTPYELTKRTGSPCAATTSAWRDSA